jgi:hypothetical protein
MRKSPCPRLHGFKNEYFGRAFGVTRKSEKRLEKLLSGKDTMINLVVTKEKAC